MKQSLTFYLLFSLISLMIVSVKCKTSQKTSVDYNYLYPDSLIHKWECSSGGLIFNDDPTRKVYTTGRQDKPHSHIWDSRWVEFAGVAVKRCIEDTPRAGIKIIANGKSENITVSRYLHFRIADSTGEVATRDSLGNWDIKDCKRALEVSYQYYLRQNKK